MDFHLESQSSLESIVVPTEARVAGPLPAVTGNWTPLSPTLLILKRKEKRGTRRKESVRQTEKGKKIITGEGILPER